MGVTRTTGGLTDRQLAALHAIAAAPAGLTHAEVKKALSMKGSPRAALTNLSGRGLIALNGEAADRWAITEEGKRRLEYVARLMQSGVVYVGGTARSLPKFAREEASRLDVEIADLTASQPSRAGSRTRFVVTVVLAAGIVWLVLWALR